MGSLVHTCWLWSLHRALHEWIFCSYSFAPWWKLNLVSVTACKLFDLARCKRFDALRVVVVLLKLCESLHLENNFVRSTLSMSLSSGFCEHRLLLNTWVIARVLCIDVVRWRHCGRIYHYSIFRLAELIDLILRVSKAAKFFIVTPFKHGDAVILRTWIMLVVRCVSCLSTPSFYWAIVEDELRILHKS